MCIHVPKANDLIIADEDEKSKVSYVNDVQLFTVLSLIVTSEH